MKSFLANWKTTSAGLALVFTALADVFHQASTGSWDGNRLIGDWTGFVGGIGLILAKDGNVTGGNITQNLK